MERFDAAFAGPDGYLGERVVRASMEAREGVAEERKPLMAMLCGATLNDQAAEQLRAFIQSRLVYRMRDRGEDATLRAGLAASMLVGITISRQIVGVPVLAQADLDTLVTVVSRGLACTRLKD